MTYQEKREKVIKGLECCLPAHDPDCNLCPYDSIDLRCRAKLRDDIIALLKAQEPRVLTLDEALNSLVIEYRSGKLREVGKHVFSGGFEYYGNIWRVWDRMPTDEQMEATPWN